MAHFAQLDADNIVLAVNVIGNDDAPDEATGIAFCKQLWGADTNWLQTSYNGKRRKNFAGVGFAYRADLDAFVAPRPSEDHTLDETTAQWRPPQTDPDAEWDGYRYTIPMVPGEPPE